MAAMVVLRRGPQEYHSAPARPCQRASGPAESLRQLATSGPTIRLTGKSGSAVVEASQRRGGRVDHVAAGKDIGLAANVLAIITTRLTLTGLFHGRHCCGSLPPWSRSEAIRKTGLFGG